MMIHPTLTAGSLGRGRTRGGAAAFTLVELLVVITIIVVLISLLVPTLGRARDQARTTVCLANLKSIGVAISGYANAFDDNMVPGCGDKPGDTWFSLLFRTGFTPAPTVPSYPSTFSPTTTSPPTPYSSVFRCPSGSFDRIAEGFNWNLQPTSVTDPMGASPTRGPAKWWASPTGFVDCWYGENAASGASMPGVAGGANAYTVALMRVMPCDDPEPPAYPLANTDYSNTRTINIPNPGLSVLIFDGLLFNPGTCLNRISARHNNQTTTNILFADGHAEPFLRKTLPMQTGPVTGLGLGSLAQYPSHLIWRLDQTH